MENNSLSKTARSDEKSKKGIMISNKSQTEWKQDTTNYSLIIHPLQVELFVVSDIQMYS